MRQGLLDHVEDRTGEQVVAGEIHVDVLVEQLVTRHPVRAVLCEDLSGIDQMDAIGVTGGCCADRLVDPAVGAEAQRIGFSGRDVPFKGLFVFARSPIASSQAELQVGVGCVESGRRQIGIDGLQISAGLLVRDALPIGLIPAFDVGGAEVAPQLRAEGRIVLEVGRHGAENHLGAAAQAGPDDVAEVAGEVIVDRLEAGIVSPHVLVDEHLEPSPHFRRPVSCRDGCQHVGHQLAEPRAFDGNGRTDHRQVARQRREYAAGPIGSCDLIVAEVHHEDVRLVTGAIPSDRQDAV